MIWSLSPWVWELSPKWNGHRNLPDRPRDRRGEPLQFPPRVFTELEWVLKVDDSGFRIWRGELRGRKDNNKHNSSNNNSTKAQTSPSSSQHIHSLNPNPTTPPAGCSFLSSGAEFGPAPCRMDGSWRGPQDWRFSSDSLWSYNGRKEGSQAYGDVWWGIWLKILVDKFFPSKDLTSKECAVSPTLFRDKERE